MKEVIDVLKNTYSMYNNTSQYYAMGSYIVLLVIALIWYVYNKDKIHKDGKNVFIYSGIMLVIVFFPITTALILDFIFSSIMYYKVFWCIPIILIIACVGAYVCFDHENQKVDKVVLLVMFMILLMAGTNPFLETNYYKTNKYLEADNLLKLDADVINICEFLNTQGGEIKIIAPTEVSINVRKYSASIKTCYGADVLREDVNVNGKYSGDYLYMYNTMNTNSPDLSFLITRAGIDQCSYIILRNANFDEAIASNWELMQRVLSDSGFCELQSVGKYTIFYKNNVVE